MLRPEPVVGQRSNSRIPGQAEVAWQDDDTPFGPVQIFHPGCSRPASPIRPGRSRSVKDMDRLITDLPRMSRHWLAGKRVARC